MSLKVLVLVACFQNFALGCVIDASHATPEEAKTGVPEVVEDAKDAKDAKGAKDANALTEIWQRYQAYGLNMTDDSAAKGPAEHPNSSPDVVSIHDTDPQLDPRSTKWCRSLIESLAVREQPDQKSKIIRRLQKGTLTSFFHQEGPWLQIANNNYISSKYCRAL